MERYHHRARPSGPTGGRVLAVTTTAVKREMKCFLSARLAHITFFFQLDLPRRQSRVCEPVVLVLGGFPLPIATRRTTGHEKVGGTPVPSAVLAVEEALVRVHHDAVAEQAVELVH